MYAARARGGQRARSRGRGSASQGTRREPRTQEGQKANESNQKRNAAAEWQNIKDNLINIKESLEKEKEWSPHFAEELGKVIARVSHASSVEDAPRTEARLERMEALMVSNAEKLEARINATTDALSKLQNNSVGGNTNSARSGSSSGTYASVAAAGLRQAGASAAMNPTRHTVRVQMPQAKGKSNEEILKEVKKTISGAAAVRVLHSGDIDVTVPDEAAKDKAQVLPSTEELRIFKKDYLVEVIAVPLGTQVACERGADNARLARAICDASRSMSPGLQITWIRWLHSQTQHAPRTQDADSKPAKTRGSLLVGFPTQEMQRRAIRGGLIIDAQLFDVRPFERNLLITQCFKCQQWGHTQKACSKQVRCAQCAGSHNTKDCPKERVSCVNCGKRHRTWQRKECPAFQAYYQGIQGRRTALYAQAYSLRTAFEKATMEDRWSTSNSQTSGDGWSVPSRKRTRPPSPTPKDTQRRLGRPTYIEQAGRDTSQQRLGFSLDLATASQTESIEPAPSQGMDLSQNE